MTTPENTSTNSIIDADGRILTNGFECQQYIKAGTQIIAELGQGKKKTRLNGVITGDEYRSTQLWVFVDLTYTNLAGVEHSIKGHAVRPTQLQVKR